MISVGLFLSVDGRIEDVLWQGPAFKAGLAPGMQMVSVDGHAYSAQVLHDAIAAAHKSKQPLQIQARSDGTVATYTVHYDGGLKDTHLCTEQDEQESRTRSLSHQELLTESG